MNKLPGLNEGKREVSFPCLKLKQPFGEFFVGVMSYRVLCEIADFDVRRVLQDDRDVERYLGIQRELQPRRVKQLEKYVNFFDATFPTSIVIAVPESAAAFDEEKKVMTFSNVVADDEGEGGQILFRQIARVLDGQHRIAGLYEFRGEEFDLNVTIFVDVDIADQAQIFSTVNLEQTKVSKSLTYDLFALATTRSPQKTCHNIAVALDQDKTSPFHKRIKRLGIATPGRYAETITQATFVESIQKYISDDPRSDRDILLRDRKLRRAESEELEKLPLRNLFIDGEDFQIADLIWSYFDAVRRRWPKAWAASGRGLMLNKTNGFRALMRVFRPAYLYLAAPGEPVSSEMFLRVFKKVQLRDDDFTIEQFKPGSSGESTLARELISQMGLEP